MFPSSYRGLTQRVALYHPVDPFVSNKIKRIKRARKKVGNRKKKTGDVVRSSE